MPADPAAPPLSDHSFTRRVVIATAVVLGTLVLLRLVSHAVTVLLMAFAAVLVAILLTSTATFVSRWTRLRHGASVILVFLLLVGGFVGLGFLIAPSISREVSELAETLPQQVKKLEGQLLQYPWARFMLNQRGAPEAGDDGGNGDTGGGAGDAATTKPASDEGNRADNAGSDGNAARTSQPSTQPTTQGAKLARTMKAAATPLVDGASHWAAGLLSAVVGVVVILAAAVYLALDPSLYIRGTLRLFPRARRERIREVFAALGYTLRWWLVGQGITMLVIGTITGVGLYFIGVRLWLTFGILAALFNFVPNFGPLVSFVPAVLFALADPEGASKVAWITLLYLVAQTFEGYVLTPLVQKKAVDTPPALLVLFQVLTGLLIGSLGLMLAAPLLAALVVVVKMLYVRDTLSDEIDEPERDALADDSRTT